MRSVERFDVIVGGIPRYTMKTLSGALRRAKSFVAEGADAFVLRRRYVENEWQTVMTIKADATIIRYEEDSDA